MKKQILKAMLEDQNFDLEKFNSYFIDEEIVLTSKDLEEILKEKDLSEPEKIIAVIVNMDEVFVPLESDLECWIDTFIDNEYCLKEYKEEDIKTAFKMFGENPEEYYSLYRIF